MSAFGDKPDTWENLLQSSHRGDDDVSFQGYKPPSRRSDDDYFFQGYYAHPTYADPSECSKEKIEISRLKDEITALNEALKEKCDTLKPSKISPPHHSSPHHSSPHHSRLKLPTLGNLTAQGKTVKPQSIFSSSRLPTLANLTAQGKTVKPQSIYSSSKLPTLANLTREKGKGGSRRFRKHKRSAARRRSTVSRRRYKTRK